MSTHISVYLLHPEGLQPVHDIKINGRICSLELFRPSEEKQDLLLVATERGQYCSLFWENGTVGWKWTGDFYEANR